MSDEPGSDKSTRPSTMAENLHMVIARLSEHLSPAERDELEEAALALSQSKSDLESKIIQYGYLRQRRRIADAEYAFRQIQVALRAPLSAASSVLPADQFARTLKVNSIIQAAWDRDAGKLAVALMSEPATAAEIHGSTEIAEVRDALSPSASSSVPASSEPTNHNGVPEWVDIEMMGIEDAEEDETWDLSVAAVRYLLERCAPSSASTPQHRGWCARADGWGCTCDYREQASVSHERSSDDVDEALTLLDTTRATLQRAYEDMDGLSKLAREQDKTAAAGFGHRLSTKINASQVRLDDLRKLLIASRSATTTSEEKKS